jgi:hypothetical protein
LAILSTLRTFSSGMPSFSASSSGVGAPDLVEQLPAFAYDLGDSAIAVLKTAEDRLR